MGIEAVIEKIRKLRALSMSTNANEAANAAAAADRLIHEHRLSEAELEASGEDGEAPEYGGELFSESRRTVWRWQLANLLCGQYDVASWRRRDERGMNYQMVGRASDVQTVRYMFGWLSREVRDIAASKPGLPRAAFCRGIVMGIAVKFAEQNKARKAAEPSGAAIVLASRADAAEAKRVEITGELKAARAHRPVADADAFYAGVREGAKIDISGTSPRLGAPAPALRETR